MEALKEIACFRFGFVCLIMGLQAKCYGVCQRGSWIYDNVMQHGQLIQFAMQIYDDSLGYLFGPHLFGFLTRPRKLGKI